jgi:hypothetical protein
MNKYRIYNAEKRRLANMGLTPKQYEQELKKLCKRLGV